MLHDVFYLLKVQIVVLFEIKRHAWEYAEAVKDTWFTSHKPKVFKSTKQNMTRITPGAGRPGGGVCVSEKWHISITYYLNGPSLPIAVYPKIIKNKFHKQFYM